MEEGDDPEQRQQGGPGKALQALDVAIAAAGKLARNLVGGLRRNSPQSTDAQLLKQLNVAYISTVTSTGAATGAAAAAPGVGTAIGLLAAAGDTSWFLTATSGYVLAVAELRGVQLENFEHQRALVLMVLAGGGGSTFVSTAASRTGPHLGEIVTNAVPPRTMRSINRTLGANFVTKYGAKRGIIAIGKVAPFGIGLVIGAGGNLFMARSVITTTKAMFDSAEKLNAEDDENSD
jgi:hypothetical protein